MKRMALRSVLLLAVLGLCAGCDSTDSYDHPRNHRHVPVVPDTNIKVVIVTTQAPDSTGDASTPSYVRSYVLDRLRSLGEGDLNTFSLSGRDDPHYTLRFRISNQYDHYSGGVDLFS